METSETEIKILFATEKIIEDRIVTAANLIKGRSPYPKMKMQLKNGYKTWEVTGRGTTPPEAANADPPVLSIIFKSADDIDGELSAGQFLVEVK